MQAVANRRRRRLETKTVGGGGLTGCSRQNKVSRGLEVKVSAAADIRLKVKFHKNFACYSRYKFKIFQNRRHMGISRKRSTTAKKLKVVKQCFFSLILLKKYFNLKNIMSLQHIFDFVVKYVHRIFKNILFFIFGDFGAY